MGYTHYFYKLFPNTRQGVSEASVIFPERYRELRPLAQHVIDIAVAQGITLDENSCVSATEIVLNGVGDDAHETFRWTAGLADPYHTSYTGGGLFAFCKTAMKPYDAVVVAMLLAIAHVYNAPDKALVKISSDGDMNGDDWVAGRELFRKALSKWEAEKSDAVKLVSQSQ